MPPARAIVADIGGTNARFAVVDLETLETSDIRLFPCSDHPSLAAAIGAYLAQLSEPPSHASIAVAAPVVGEDIRLTNSPWSFARGELRQSVGLDHVHVLNDFQALALSLPHLAPEELVQIGGGDPVEHAPKVVLGPGTGLGMAGLVWSTSGWVAVASEGGHICLGAHDSRELALLEHLRGRRAHLSVERALSGPGLADLYQAVAAYRGEGKTALLPNEVVARAMAKEDDIAVEALANFVTWLGRFAGDAALMYGARGGVYLGGGIPPRIVEALGANAFRASFEEKGRMCAFLQPIPVFVILAEFAALKGAAAGLRDALAGQGGDART
jgi:glucokinase